MTQPARHPNAGAGETLVFLTGERDHDLRIVLELDAVHHAPPAHVHPGAAESFTITEGLVDVRVGGRWRTMGVGESATVPAGVVHGYRNTSGSPARMEVQVAPGDAMRGFLTDLYALAAAGKLDAKGSLSLPQAAQLFRRHPDAMTLPVLPIPVQRGLWRILAPFAKR